jgi:Rrf2 family iron-sulfur cluster assembly transcriptional regulator
MTITEEEYGLRVFLRIARHDQKGKASVFLPSAKQRACPQLMWPSLTRMLRISGYINSTPGYKGGYVLAQPADQININQGDESAWGCPVQ